MKMAAPTQERRPREGWPEQFHRMHEAGDDQLIQLPSASAWDEDQWEWEWETSSCSVESSADNTSKDLGAK